MFIDESSNYWKFRIREPRKGSQYAYKHEGISNGIDIVYIIINNKPVIQALRFHKNVFKSKKSVVSWLKVHPQFRYIG